tara:strand:- start:1189 stop:1392 length:204 start_codon:yes stop_codon:yes gene_type:complete
MSDDLLDQAIFKALDDKSLLPKKPIRIGHLVVDKNGVPTPRVQGKRKLTNRKKINASVKRREKNEEV